MDPAELFSIRGKTAVVTGGSRGIRRMIATGFVVAGAAIFLSSRASAYLTGVVLPVSGGIATID
jgi:NAD(P)-dependent dehydrogenase (short-subunit alcohol dehydrogenase family)